MFLKFSILLLFFILAFNCMTPEWPGSSSSAAPNENTEADMINDMFKDLQIKEISDDQIIEDLFKCFLKMLTEVEGFDTRLPIEMVLCTLYLGATKNDVQITYDYLNGHTGKDYEFLHLDLFRKIVKHHCIIKTISVQNCANIWKDSWVKKNKAFSSVFITSLAAPNENTEVKLVDKKLKDSQIYEIIDNQIIEDSFKCFLKVLTEVVGYNTNHPIAMVRCIPHICETIQDVQITNDYLNRPTGKSHEFLNSDLFGKILKHHSIEKSISVQECANRWKNLWIIEEAFKDCTNAIKIINRIDHIVECISTRQFSTYMTDYDNKDNIVFYNVREHYPRQNHALCWIDSRIFKELFMNHCRKFRLSVKEVAELRKEKTIKRIKRGIERDHK